MSHLATKRKAEGQHPVASYQMPTPSQGDIIHIDDDEDIDNAPEDVNELYCQLRTTIVGIQYYDGMVGPGEEVILQREPNNKYDRNAVQVLNIIGVQIGHIPRNIAGKLSPLMRISTGVAVEGVVLDGNLGGRRAGQYNLNMTLKFYAPGNQRNIFEPLLTWATPGQRGFPARNANSSNNTHQIPGVSQASGSGAGAYGSQQGAYSSQRTGAGAAPLRGAAAPVPSRTGRPNAGRSAAEEAARQEAIRKQQLALQQAAELRSVLSGLEKIDDQGRRSSVMDTLCAVDDILALPEHPNPPGIASGDLTTDLLPHQRQGLQWCIEKEHPKLPSKEEDKPVQFWQYKKNGTQGYYLNIATKTPQAQPPSLNKGGLVADSMGLGKTLTILALILATKADIPADFSRSTLIIVPLSVLSNWEVQIKEHIAPGAASSFVYYGAGRNVSPAGLMKHDIVITTYNVVVSEWGALSGDSDGKPTKKKQKTSSSNSLFGVNWKRIVLDEGHNIRNSKTKMALSVCALAGERRWVLSGTPIINSPKDLGSLLKFMRICAPLDQDDFFTRLVLRPLKNGELSGAEILRAIMTQVCIHRTKEMKYASGEPLVKLPAVEMTVVPVTLSPSARALYDELDELARARLETDIASSGFSMAVRTNALSMLTRMRQLVLHPGLVPTNFLKQLKESLDDTIPEVSTLTPELQARLQQILVNKVEDSEECPVCIGPLENPRITPCAHCYCFTCIMEVLARDNRCPMDRRPLSAVQLVEMPPPTDSTQVPLRIEEEEGDHMEGKSDKISHLIHLLQLTPAADKSLVFSQFTSFLDKIAEELDEAGISYCRFDGKMSAQRRSDTIKRFSVPIKANNAPVIDMPPPSGRPSRAARARRKPQTTAEVIDIDDDSGSDFAAEWKAESDFDDDDDASVVVRKKGKGKAIRTSSHADLDLDLDDGLNDANPKVMLISLKAGALGLNLTVANNVYLMDPWWQESIESQAIDRCNRIGQKKPVNVYQLVAEDTVESKVLDIQMKKKRMIDEAFSGIKSNATQRQKKEARLQDLMQLFGLRRQISEVDE